MEAAASDAVPALLEIVDDDDFLASSAAEAIKKIDPKAAAKAGIR